MRAIVWTETSLSLSMSEFFMSGGWRVRSSGSCRCRCRVGSCATTHDVFVSILHGMVWYGVWYGMVWYGMIHGVW